MPQRYVDYLIGAFFVLLPLGAVGFLPGGDQAGPLEWFTPIGVSLLVGIGLRGCARWLLSHLAHFSSVPVSLALFWTPLASCWSYFWWMDLRHALFQVTLLVVPLAAGLGYVVGMLRDAASPSARPWPKADVMAVFMLVAASLLWCSFRARSLNGCTGVSRAYDITLLASLVVVFGVGPHVVGMHLRRIRESVGGDETWAGRGAPRSRVAEPASLGGQ